MLFRQTVADHCLLDLHRRILRHGHSCFGAGKQNDSPRLRHTDTGRDIFCKEQLLDRHLLRAVLFQKRVHAAAYGQETLRRIHPRRGLNGSITQRPEAGAGIIHHAPADNGKSGVYAEYDHVPLPPSVP